jgi:predicted transposase YbfD/YdcC
MEIKKIWGSVDGKALRGSQSLDNKQNIVVAVTHETRELIGQGQQKGTKSSEIPVVRTLLKETQLETQKMSLDAHHCNPETTAQIHQAGGIYLTQVKNNQPVLLKQCQALQSKQLPVAKIVKHDKAHGRVTVRRSEVFSLIEETLAPRWEESGINTLVVIERETFTMSTKKTTVDSSYYISNQAIDNNAEATAEELTTSVRKHWGVESNNWIRDVTFGEDHVKVKAENQAQIMGRLRSLAITLIQKAGIKNFQASIERFIDLPETLESLLRQVNFL